MDRKAVSGVLAFVLALAPSSGWAGRVAALPAKAAFAGSVVPVWTAGPMGASGGVLASPTGILPLWSGYGTVAAPAPAVVTAVPAAPAILPAAPGLAPEEPAGAPHPSALQTLLEAELPLRDREERGPRETGAAAAGRAFDGSGVVEGGGIGGMEDVFEAAPPSSREGDLGVEGVTVRGDRLFLEGRELELLGRGDFGAVYVHPKVRGAVIKLAALSLAAVLSIAMPVSEVARQDSLVGRRLAEARVGPRVLGTVSLREEPVFWRRWAAGFLGRQSSPGGRPAVVKERVYGRTVRELMDEGAFTAREYGLVQDMLRRMAQARVRVSDLRASNIMVGRTESDPEARAYLVDGGFLLPVAAAETTEAIYASLKNQRTVPIQAKGGGSGAWGEASYEPLDDILRAGLSGP